MRFYSVFLSGIVAAWLLTTSMPGAVAAQDRGWDAAQIQLSRTDLEQLLARYEANAGSPAYSDALRAQARRQAGLIRARLEQGDFQIGDQIALSVEGEEPLTSTFVVQDGPSIVLPVIGTLSLRGVLRSELEPHLRTAIGKYIRDPAVQARSSIRIMIMGAVVKRGYFVVPADMVVSDLLTLAGGPSPTARLDELQVQRGGEELWGGEAFQQAIIEGRTLDQLGFRAGDQLFVPAGSGGALQTLQSLRYVGAAIGGLALLTRVVMTFF
jgi:protein involved in polysaccharide export with SLBB domain